MTLPFLGSGSAGPGSQAIGRPRTYVNVVLDESSSMSHVTDETIQAYNDFLKQQREASMEAKDEVFVSFIKFGDHARSVYAREPLENAPELSRNSYRPDGMTALYDGIYLAIDATEKSVGTNARVLTLVITDGGENNSRHVTDEDVIRQMIEEREQRGNWTFAFLSAGSNPFRAGQGMGFQPGNINTYAASASASQALVAAGQSLRSFRNGDAMQTGTFWAGEADKHKRPDWTQTNSEDVEDVV